ncbi:hypothetical protein KBI23_13055 [bacterium]|jgi:hypothetical protein|nr:hypothetical protein [bacterium]
MEKPKNVVLAVNLLWASLVLGLVKGALTGFKTASEAGPVFIAIVLAITLAIVALLVFKISAGKNWARIAYAVLFLCGIPICVGLFVDKQIMQSPVDSILILLQTALQGYAMYLVCTKPGSSWFHKAAVDAKPTDA